jgi:hypothetical protein
VHETEEDYQRATQVLEHKGLWRRCACFYGQLPIFQREGMWPLLTAMWHKCATPVSSAFWTRRQSKLEEIYGKNLESSGVCCFRAKNSVIVCGKHRRTGVSDPNRLLF